MIDRSRRIAGRCGEFFHLRTPPRPQWPPPAGARIAYVMNRFPNLTETFVYRELETLRRRGFDIVAISIRCPPSDELSAESLPLRAATRYVFPIAIGELFAAHLRALLASAPTYLSALFDVCRGSHGRRRDRWRSLCHFAEAVTLIEPLRAAGISHLHGHFAVGATTVAWVVARFLDVPFSFTAHAYDIWRDRLLLQEKLDAARFVVTCTGYNRAHLLETYKPRAPIHVVHHGVDVARFKPRATAPGDVTRVLSVGRLCEQKGFATLLEACARRAAAGDRFECRIVGEGPLGEELRELASRLGLADRVQFTGRLFQEEMLAQYAWADLFALACTRAGDDDRDGIPNVLMEAMACGLPVVTTRFSGIPELVSDGRDGLLVEPNDAAAFAAALQRMFADAALRRRFGKAGREKVERDFALATSAARLDRLFGRDGAATAASPATEVRFA